MANRKSLNKHYRFETRFFLVTLPAVAIITLAGWARAESSNGSGIVKGPELSFSKPAKQRSCQIVERVNPDTGKVTRKLQCSKGKKGKSK